MRGGRRRGRRLQGKLWSGIAQDNRRKRKEKYACIFFFFSNYHVQLLRCFLYFSVVTDPVDVSTVLNKCLKKMFVYKFIEPMVGTMVIAADGILFFYLIYYIFINCCIFKTLNLMIRSDGFFL